MSTNFVASAAELEVVYVAIARWKHVNISLPTAAGLPIFP